MATKHKTAGRKKTAKVPSTTQEYLASLPSDQRAALQKLRRVINATAPELEECIAYGVPAFRLNGKYLLSYGAAAQHCAFYPGSVVQKMKDELKDYSTAKGTIRFSPAQPLPDRIIAKLVRLRVAQRRTN